MIALIGIKICLFSFSFFILTQFFLVKLRYICRMTATVPEFCRFFPFAFRRYLVFSNTELALSFPKSFDKSVLEICGEKSHCWSTLENLQITV